MFCRLAICASFSGCVFLFRDVGFRFGLCISVSCFTFFLIFCFCCGHPVSGEKLLLHRGFGKFGKSLYTYGFHFFKFVSEWTDDQMQFVEGGRVGPFV